MVFVCSTDPSEVSKFLVDLDWLVQKMSTFFGILHHMMDLAATIKNIKLFEYLSVSYPTIVTTKIFCDFPFSFLPDPCHPGGGTMHCVGMKLPNLGGAKADLCRDLPRATQISDLSEDGRPNGAVG